MSDLRTIGNGAREALTDIARAAPDRTSLDAEKWSDWLLLQLGIAGFKIVPLNGKMQ